SPPAVISHNPRGKRHSRTNPASYVRSGIQLGNRRKGHVLRRSRAHVGLPKWGLRISRRRKTESRSTLKSRIDYARGETSWRPNGTPARSTQRLASSSRTKVSWLT